MSSTQLTIHNQSIIGGDEAITHEGIAQRKYTRHKVDIEPLALVSVEVVARREQS